MSKDAAAALKALRAQLGISQVELATRLGVNPSTVARWESGSTSPRWSIEAIAGIAAGTAATAGVVGGVAAGLGLLATGPLGLGLFVAGVIRNASRRGMSTEDIASLFEQQDATVTGSDDK